MVRPLLDTLMGSPKFLANHVSLLLLDSSFHLSEECSNASVATPRSIVMTAVSGSILGFILNVLIAYTIQDVEQIFESDLVSQWRQNPRFLPPANRPTGPTLGRVSDSNPSRANRHCCFMYDNRLRLLNGPGLHG